MPGVLMRVRDVEGGFVVDAGAHKSASQRDNDSTPKTLSHGCPHLAAVVVNDKYGATVGVHKLSGLGDPVAEDGLQARGVAKPATDCEQKLAPAQKVQALALAGGLKRGQLEHRLVRPLATSTRVVRGRQRYTQRRGCRGSLGTAPAGYCGLSWSPTRWTTTA